MKGKIKILYEEEHTPEYEKLFAEFSKMSRDNLKKANLLRIFKKLEKVAQNTPYLDEAEYCQSIHEMHRVYYEVRTPDKYEGRISLEGKVNRIEELENFDCEKKDAKIIGRVIKRFLNK